MLIGGFAFLVCLGLVICETISSTAPDGECYNDFDAG